MSGSLELVQLQPATCEYNQKLASNVHPPDWVNPTPAQRYNLVVIGAGTAGLVTAAGAAGLGAKVALVERQLMGGDCLNVGCVPSKGLISASRVAAQVRNAGNFGIEVPPGVTASFPKAMERMRRLRAQISENDSATRFQKLGVDVFLGEARFGGPDRVLVGDATLRFKKAVIATGARAAAPAIQGLDQIDYLTNESVFSLTELPSRLGIIGAGPIGCEMAQAFARIGSEVYLVEAEHGILPREDRDAAKIVEEALVRDGVRVLCCGRKTEIREGDSGEIRLTLESHGRAYDESIDQLLVSVGRAPNIESLDLEAAGVKAHKQGIEVNGRLQTANPNIYAAGDVASRYQFTHAADFMARLVIRNALFRGRSEVDSLIIPWCTYTSPEIAHVGLYEAQAHEKGIEVDTFVQEMADVDRAILEGETEGFVKVQVQRGTDRIVGATIVAQNAGDLISPITLAMKNGIGLKGIADTIHPYPTQAEATRKVGDLYNRTRLTPGVQSLFRTWLRWTR